MYVAEEGLRAAETNDAAHEPAYRDLSGEEASSPAFLASTYLPLDTSHPAALSVNAASGVEIAQGMLAAAPFVPPALAAAVLKGVRSAVEELKLLKMQLGDVARVCIAVGRGDLAQKITVEVEGPVMVQLKDVVNTMVSNHSAIPNEVPRTSTEIGREPVFAASPSDAHDLGSPASSRRGRPDPEAHQYSGVWRDDDWRNGGQALFSLLGLYSCMYDKAFATWGHKPWYSRGATFLVYEAHCKHARFC
jgi:hypothetical protein